MDHLPHLAPERPHYRVPYLEPPADRPLSALLADYPLQLVLSKLQNDETSDLCDTVIQQLVWHNPLEALHRACGIRYDRDLYIVQDEEGSRLSTLALQRHFIPSLFYNVVRPQVEANFGNSAFELEVLAQLTDKGVLRCWNTREDIKQRIQAEFNGQADVQTAINNAFFTGKTQHAHREATRTRYRSIAAGLALLEYIRDICMSFVLGWPEGPAVAISGFTVDARVSIRRNGRCVSRTLPFPRFSSLWMLAWMLPNTPDDSHAECRDVKCVQQSPTRVMPADESHSPACDGSCDVVRVDPGELIALIREGKYAVLSELPNDGKNTIKLEAGISGKFVAISHVWSHGLGNPNANNMRRCHLQRILDCAKFANLPSAIWIDTLCVPPVQVYPDDWRLALNRMKDVYRDAGKVLVIDRHLDTFVGTNTLERQIELLLCDWMHRLWTLQEMLLPVASDIYIVFTGSAVPLTELLRLNRLAGVSTAGVERLFCDALASVFQFDDAPQPDAIFRKPLPDVIEGALSKSRASGSFQDFRFQLDTTNVENELVSMIDHPGTRAALGIDRFGHIVHALCARVVTNVSDEPICISTLMDIDLQTLPGVVTFESIWAHLGTAPTWILHSTAERLETQGFQWAPRTFLGCPVPESSESIMDGGFGAVTENGLLLQHDILIFEAPTAWFGASIVDGARCWVPHQEVPIYFEAWPISHVSQKPRSSCRLGLLPHNLIDVWNGGTTAVTLVQIMSRQDGCIKVERVCSGMLQRNRDGLETSRPMSSVSWIDIHVELMTDVDLLVD